MTKSQIAITIGGSLIGFFLVFVFTGLIPGLRPNPETVVKPTITQIKFWGIKDESSGLKSIISSYEGSHPNVKISYTAVDEPDYEKDLIDNLAAGTGPDVFMLPNSWVPQFRAKIAPAPDNLFTIARITDIFPPVVTSDFVFSGKIWGLPVSIDTLALAYNRNIFDSKQLALPPSTWEDVKNIVPKIREFNSGALSKPAIALGGNAASVTNATDILTAIMLQLKSKVIDLPLRKAAIDNNAGMQAINLYVGFSDPQAPSYSWNDSFKNSIDSFVNGKVAMAFVYKRQINDIKRQNPLLNFIIAPLPQFDPNNPINIANYSGLVVANQSRNQDIAWDFIKYATTTASTAKNYTMESGLPPALRELIPAYQNDPSIGIFASQSLTVQSVPYIQYPPVSEVLNNMIESILINRSSAQSNLKAAEDKINEIIR